jgi:hypothetical protein
MPSFNDELYGKASPFQKVTDTLGLTSASERYYGTTDPYAERGKRGKRVRAGVLSSIALIATLVGGKVVGGKEVDLPKAPTTLDLEAESNLRAPQTGPKNKTPLHRVTQSSEKPSPDKPASTPFLAQPEQPQTPQEKSSQSEISSDLSSNPELKNSIEIVSSTMINILYNPDPDLKGNYSSHYQELVPESGGNFSNANYQDFNNLYAHFMGDYFVNWGGLSLTESQTLATSFWNTYQEKAKELNQAESTQQRDQILISFWSENFKNFRGQEADPKTKEYWQTIIDNLRENHPQHFENGDIAGRLIKGFDSSSPPSPEIVAAASALTSPMGEELFWISDLLQQEKVSTSTPDLDQQQTGDQKPSSTPTPSVEITITPPSSALKVSANLLNQENISRLPGPEDGGGNFETPPGIIQSLYEQLGTPVSPGGYVIGPLFAEGNNYQADHRHTGTDYAGEKEIKSPWGGLLVYIGPQYYSGENLGRGPYTTIIYHGKIINNDQEYAVYSSTGHNQGIPQDVLEQYEQQGVVKIDPGQHIANMGNFGYGLSDPKIIHNHQEIILVPLNESNVPNKEADPFSDWNGICPGLYYDSQDGEATLHWKHPFYQHKIWITISERQRGSQELLNPQNYPFETKETGQIPPENQPVAYILPQNPILWLAISNQPDQRPSGLPPGISRPGKVRINPFGIWSAPGPQKSQWIYNEKGNWQLIPASQLA